MRHQACHKASRIFFCADCHISPPSIVLVSVAPPCVGVDRRSPCGVFSFARPPSSRRQRKPTAASPSAERGTPFVSPSNLDTMPHFFRQLCRWFMRHFVPSAPSTSAASPTMSTPDLSAVSPHAEEKGAAPSLLHEHLLRLLEEQHEFRYNLPAEVPEIRERGSVVRSRVFSPWAERFAPFYRVPTTDEAATAIGWWTGSGGLVWQNCAKRAGRREFGCDGRSFCFARMSKN